MTPADNLLIGLNGRFFASNWRPALDEIAFAQAHGFGAIQFRGKEAGLGAEHLGAELGVVAQALRQAGLTPVMEIVVPVNEQGVSATGHTPLATLRANLPAIETLGCCCVHWHPVPTRDTSPAAIPAIEQALLEPLAAGAELGVRHGFRFGLEHNAPDLRLFGSPAASPAIEQALLEPLAAGAELGVRHGFRFGLEHNAPDLRLFGSPAACAAALDAVPALGFVWDFNHTTPVDRDAFKALIPRMSMLHVADTPLPQVNHHLPLGEGSVDLADYCRALRQGGFAGPAILEIGGLPQSGGFGRDTDAALVASLRRLRDANRAP